MTSAADERPVIPYRPDIDGLRAISVVAVILYHFDVKWFAGGYIGVDVFFVISGYLITQLLMSSTGRTMKERLVEFYLRRTRRILPALLAMLIVATAIAVPLFLAYDLSRYGRSLAFATLMLGNVGSWITGNYFDLRGRFTPLEHLWSIGVEEQFYLLYPAVFFLTERLLPRVRTLLLYLFLAVSLAVCIWASYRKPTANYYLLPTRGWELLAGAAVAIGVVRLSWRKGIAELASLAALGAIGIAVYSYDAAMMYPGLNAVVPVLATSLLLAANSQRRTEVGRILSWQPFVLTGLISYSLYLWHAPVYEFFCYFNIRPPNGIQLILLLSIIYSVAFFSWRVIERPIRRKAFLNSDRKLIVSLILVSGVLVTCGTFLFRSDGVPQRLSPTVRALTARPAPIRADIGRCMTLSLRAIESGDLCRFGDIEHPQTSVVVWGDSHALIFIPAFEAIATARRAEVYFAGQSSCRPLIGVRSRGRNEVEESNCSQFNEAMVRAVEKLRPDVVILNAFWTNPTAGFSSTPMGANAADAAANLERGLKVTGERIGSNAKQICLVLDPPTLEYNLPYALAMAQRRNIDIDFQYVSRTEAYRQSGPMLDAFQKLRSERVIVVDPKAILCAADRCMLSSKDGLPLYLDTNHLSPVGVRLVAPSLVDCFEPRPPIPR